MVNRINTLGKARDIFDKNVAKVEAEKGFHKYNASIDVDTFLNELHWVAELGGHGYLDFYIVEIAIQNTLKKMKEKQ